MTTHPSIAVLGAGTMGAGIAQVALAKGFPVVLYDVGEPGLAKARQAIEKGLAKQAEKGQIPSADEALGRLKLTTHLPDLVEVALAIEAAPESIALKQDLFRYLDENCAPDTILASNTSSLSITALAGACTRPERVVGLHFFNPAPLMALVEVVAGTQTSPEALARARAFAERLGKTPVLAKDTPGFIVNRVARPFYGEALKILGEGESDHATIDQIMKGVGGFRMGPFELMDMIGIDVNFAVTQSVFNAFFGDPRYRPHPIQQRMVEAGRLGRKTQRGFYDYA